MTTGDTETVGKDMVGKALSLLTVLGPHPDGATLSDLARWTGYPVTTTHRLLGSLVRDDFVSFNPETKLYSLGLRLFQLGAAVSSAHGFQGVALPVLRTLSRATGEASLMSVLDGEHQLYIHHIEARHHVGVRGETGKLGPLHCTSMGKVLIAFAEWETRDHLVSSLPLERFTSRTITERAAFAAEIARVRSQGFAVSNEEHEEGIVTVGVPVLDAMGIAVAALSVPSPAYRTTVEQALQFLGPLREAAAELAVLLPRR